MQYPVPRILYSITLYHVVEAEDGHFVILDMKPKSCTFTRQSVKLNVTRRYLIFCLFLFCFCFVLCFGPTVIGFHCSDVPACMFAQAKSNK